MDIPLALASSAAIILFSETFERVTSSDNPQKWHPNNAVEVVGHEYRWMRELVSQLVQILDATKAIQKAKNLSSLLLGVGNTESDIIGSKVAKSTLDSFRNLLFYRSSRRRLVELCQQKADGLYHSLHGNVDGRFGKS